MTYCRIVHTDVCCNNCNVSPIVGIRYKCLQCVNYDLCQVCIDKLERDSLVASVGGTTRHDHLFVKVTNPIKAGGMPMLCNRENWKHEGIQCFHCNVLNIVGWRYLCVQCGINLCESCELEGKHDIGHPLLKMSPVKPPISTVPGITFTNTVINQTPHLGAQRVHNPFDSGSNLNNTNFGAGSGLYGNSKYF